MTSKHMQGYRRISTILHLSLRSHTPITLLSSFLFLLEQKKNSTNSMNLFFSLGSVISCHSISSIMSHSVCVAFRVTAYTNSRVAYEISALQTGKQQTHKQRSNQQQQHNYRSRLSKKTEAALTWPQVPWNLRCCWMTYQ